MLVSIFNKPESNGGNRRLTNLLFFGYLKMLASLELKFSNQ